MEIILLQNTVLAGARYAAGESVVVDAAVADQMIKAELAYVPKSAEVEAQAPAAKRSTRKAASK